MRSFKRRPKLIFSRLGTVLLTLSLILSCSGCGSSDQQPEGQQQSAQGQAEEEKVPDKLKNLEKSIESIILSLNGPSMPDEEKQKEDEQKEQAQPSQGNNQSQSSQSGGGQSGGGQSGGGQSGGGQSGGGQSGGGQSGGGQSSQQGQQPSQPSQKPTVKDPWKDASTVINNLHYQWNDYAPDAVKKGASRELTDKFGNNLNLLTSEILKKDRDKTMGAANLLYSSIADFYSLYRSKTSPEVKRMRYYVRGAILAAVIGDWPKAAEHSADLKASWTLFKNTLDKDQQDLSGKLDLAVYEFDKVVAVRDAQLSDIKGRVVLSDMAEIEKAMEKQQ